MSGKTLKDMAAEKFSDTITVQGIAIEGVTPERLDDFEFVEAVAIISDPDTSDGETLRSLAFICPVIFGQSQWKRIKAALREQNGGRLTGATVLTFVLDVLNALNSKNS